MDKVNPSELVAFSDVDNTIVFDCEPYTLGAIAMDYYGTTKYCRPHKKQIEFIRSLHARGYSIYLMSANGSQWAKEVRDKLNIQDAIYHTMMKPLKYIDDLNCVEWMGARIYLSE